MTARAQWIFALLLLVILAASGPYAQTPDQPPAAPPVASQPQGRPAAPGQAPVPGQAIAADEYRIGPEDVLDISVWKNAELTRTVAVRPDGRISVPLLNDIQAANMTPMQLRDVLAKGYSKYVSDAEVSVIVREIHSFKVSVVGLVKNPGRYELRSQATVLEALALAGGLTEFAKKDRIVVFRNDGRRWLRIAFDYNQAIYDNAEQNFQLRPGDIVIVP
jgi:polysaccharide export outer membrane protein